jgi:hypothetical protein
MSRIILSAALVLGAFAFGSTAIAAKPVSQACLGASVSSAAQNIPEYGGLVSGAARATDEGNRPGVGDDVQAIQAGAVPDEDFPNTCND